MTPIEADRLVARYRSYWPHGGPANDALAAEFVEMDAGALGTELIRLARETDTAPAIARLWRAYRELDTKRPEPVTCPTDTYDAKADVWNRCDGWVTVDEYKPGYRGSVPCPDCGDARGTARTWRSIQEPQK